MVPSHLTIVTKTMSDPLLRCKRAPHRGGGGTVTLTSTEPDLTTPPLPWDAYTRSFQKVSRPRRSPGRKSIEVIRVFRQDSHSLLAFQRTSSFP